MFTQSESHKINKKIPNNGGTKYETQAKVDAARVNEGETWIKCVC